MSANDVHEKAMDAINPSTKPPMCECVSDMDSLVYINYITFVMGCRGLFIKESVNLALEKAKEGKALSQRCLDLIDIMQKQIDSA